jgi:hypothetical protein
MSDPAAEFPAPGPGLRVTFAAWKAGREIHRIHHRRWKSTDFNGSRTGNARFSPIADAAGKTIPMLYGGSTFECAAMETVFRDVPFAPIFKRYEKDRLLNQRSSTICATRELRLVDLSGTALRKLGISPARLTASEAEHYPKTRQWALALHEQCPEADGLMWMSRQDNRAQALMLFGDRVKPADLRELRPPIGLLDDPVYERILALALAIGVDIIV